MYNYVITLLDNDIIMWLNVIIYDCIGVVYLVNLFVLSSFRKNYVHTITIL